MSENKKEINLIELIKKGILIENELHAEEEKAKLGNCRGGSCGHFKNGVFEGTCPRTTLLRMEGIQTETDYNTKMMFEMGKCHEDFVKRMLELNPLVVKVTDEYEMKSEIDGIPWTGRADFMVEMKDGDKFIIETKAIAASSSACKIIGKNVPYMKAVCQAALYKLRTGLKAKILYGLYFQARQFKESHRPQLVEFDLGFKGDIILLKNSDGVIDTGLTVSGLDAYYREIIRCRSEEILPDRMIERELNGIKTYDHCAYCAYQGECEDYDAGIASYEDFMRNCREVI